VHACVRECVLPVANQQTQDPLTFKMAPWPEQGNEPKAPDKSCGKGGDSSLSDPAKVISGTKEDVEVTDTANKTDYKQVLVRNLLPYILSCTF
jgi:hypothetical protein